MKRLLTGWCLLSAGLIGGCAPVYTQGASDIAGGVTSLDTYSKTLVQNQIDSQQLYYDAKFIIHHAAPATTPGCDKAADYKDCFMSDTAELSGETALTIKANEDLLTAIRTQLPETRSYQDTLKQLALPDVCVAEIEREVQNPEPAPKTEVKAAEPTEEGILKVLVEYAKGLEAVTKKSDSDEYKASAAKLGTSVGALASTIGLAAGGAGAAIGPVAKAVTSLGTRAYLAILEERRYQALKVAVLAACLPVRNLATAEGAVLKTHLDVANRNYRSVMDLYQTPRLPPQDRAQLRPLAMQAMTGLRSGGGNPKEMTGKLFKSHNELVIAVTSGTGQTAALLEAISDFVADAQTLKDAAQKAGGSTVAAK